MIEVTYQQMGDYQIPQVVLPKTKKMTQGRFSRMREKFLKEHKKGLYEELMLDGKVEEHLGEIEETAQKRLKQIIKNLAEKNKVNEQMKQTDQMGWVQEMNLIKNQAEEMVMMELIYN
ncbi:MAG: TnpV protein [Clostridia bacterium]|nr:TnpV protein [Clostridia bacterium]